jgi:hypothetical protein
LAFVVLLRPIHLFQANGMKAQVKQFFPSGKMYADRLKGTLLARFLYTYNNLRYHVLFQGRRASIALSSPVSFFEAGLFFHSFTTRSKVDEYQN